MPMSFEFLRLNGPSAAPILALALAPLLALAQPDASRARQPDRPSIEARNPCLEQAECAVAVAASLIPVME